MFDCALTRRSHGWPTRTYATAMLVGCMAALVSPAFSFSGEEDDAGSAQNSKGYNANDVFVTIDGSDINAFNFNFVTQFPLAIGLTYPENGNLGLALQLVYNSRVWFWQFSLCHYVKYFRIRRENPVGLGFDLSLGRIVVGLVPQGPGPWQYVEPSGARHNLVFYRTTAEGEEYRTHDGSHLKAVKNASGWLVYSGDGIVREFYHNVPEPHKPDLDDNTECCIPNIPGHDFGTCPANVAEVFVPEPPLGDPGRDPDWDGHDRDFVGWHLTKVYSRADVSAWPSSYTVTYHPEPFSHIPQFIDDQHGRRIEIIIETTGPMRGLVTEIRTPAPPDSAGIPRTAVYNLNYAQQTLTIQGQQHTVWVLTKLQGPTLLDGRRYTHSFTYSSSVDYPPGPDTEDYPGGQLEKVFYPSGKLIRISYTRYSYTSSEEWCSCQGGTDKKENPSWGVSKIEKFLDGNEQNSLPENYRLTVFTQKKEKRRDYAYGGECSGCQPGYTEFDQLHEMVDPAGKRTQFLYRTPKDPQEENWYGLLVSEKYYGGNDLLKEVTYDYPQLDSYPSYHDYEMRESEITTTYHDDKNADGSLLPVPTTLIEIRQDYDNCGHAQRVVYRGNAVGEEERVVITDYAADNTVGGQLCPNAQRLQDAWLCTVVARKEVRKQVGGWASETVRRTDYGYDPDRGVTTEAVARKDVGVAVDPCTADPIESIADLVTKYEYTCKGDLRATERFIQGETGEAGRHFRLEYTYRYGALESRRNPGLDYYDFVRVIDQGSGLPLEERLAPLDLQDTSGEVVKIEYDVVGRKTKTAAGNEEAQETLYEHEDGFEAGEARLVRVRQVQGTDDARIEMVDHFARSRLEKQEKLMPDGTAAFRYFRYDNADRVSFVSEWTAALSAADVPGTVTDYTFTDSQGQAYEDPFGRPAVTIGPFGERTEYRYFGTNKKVTVFGIASGQAEESPINATTVFYTDALGRLREVDAPAGADAIYTYDVDSSLRTVNLVDGLQMAPSSLDRYATSNGTGQRREFTYDSLGRLASSTHPESGTTRVLSWNARGDPIEVQDALGAAQGHRHRTSYDVAGRPIKTERVLDSGQAPFSQVYQPGDPGWQLDGGWRVTDPTDPCVSRGAWYHGTPDCQYAQGAAQTASLTSPEFRSVPSGSTLSFEYFREVRFETGGGRDRLRVQILVPEECDPEVPGDCAGKANSWVVEEEAMFLDSGQMSWSRWMRSPALPIAGGRIKIRFVFESVDANGDGTLRGIAIGEVAVRRPSSVTLTTTAYDEDFGLTGNKPRGKMTTSTVYDESLLAPTFRRRYEYLQEEGRLTRERFFLDWDRDGVSEEFEADYDYNSMGQLTTLHLPHPSGTPARAYHYAYRHGALVGITSDNAGQLQSLVPDSPGNPGIHYVLAGDVDLIRYANGTLTHIDRNAASLPERIWVEHPGGTPSSPLFDSGTYAYDGTRNIKQISSDLYRYDAIGRLDWARVTSTDYPTGLEVDYSYDSYGNMLSRTTNPPGSGPAGLHFTGRSYSGNRITNPGYTYDANGNLTTEPIHEGVGGYRYRFSAENQLHLIRDVDVLSGKIYQEAQYDANGHRWVQLASNDGGKPVVSLRDASGRVVSEYLADSATSGLKLQKEYVYGAGRLLVVNSACGPRPDLKLADPPESDGQVWFDRTDHVTPVGSFTIFIEAEDGRWKSRTEPSTLPAHFGIPKSELFPGQNNWISIETEAACGQTGYSNAVSYVYYSGPTPPSCITGMGVSRDGFGSGGSSSLTLSASSGCLPATRYNAYYQRADTVIVVRLNAQPLPTARWVLPDQPRGTGHGKYWFKPVDPLNGREGEMSPQATVDERNSPHVLGGGGQGGGGGGAGAAPAVNAQYLHCDHLDSTRLITDEKGVVVASWKFYPFGHEADSIGGRDNRVKFMGHERDQTDLDYMLARSFSPSLSRFLAVDPIRSKSTRISDPQRLNLYAFVSNNPLVYVDPTGEDVFLAVRPVKRTGHVFGHLFLIITFTGGNVGKFPNNQLIISGHPDPGESGAISRGEAKLRIFISSLGHRGDAPDTASAKVKVEAKGMSTEQLELAVTKAAEELSKKMNASPHPYEPLGVNSNTAALQILREAGMSDWDIYKLLVKVWWRSKLGIPGNFWVSEAPKAGDIGEGLSVSRMSGAGWELIKTTMDEWDYITCDLVPCNPVMQHRLNGNSDWWD